jgi:hypothetical protein
VISYRKTPLPYSVSNGTYRYDKKGSLADGGSKCQNVKFRGVRANGIAFEEWGLFKSKSRLLKGAFRSAPLFPPYHTVGDAVHSQHRNGIGNGVCGQSSRDRGNGVATAGDV